MRSKSSIIVVVVGSPPVRLGPSKRVGSAHGTGGLGTVASSIETSNADTFVILGASSLRKCVKGFRKIRMARTNAYGHATTLMNSTIPLRLSGVTVVLLPLTTESPLPQALLP